MNKNYYKYLIIIVLVLFVVEAISCSGRAGSPGNAATPANAGSPIDDVAISDPSGDPVPEIKLFSVSAPLNYAVYSVGDEIVVELAIERDNREIDSIVVTYDNEAVASILSEPWRASVPSNKVTKTGRKTLKVTAFSDGKAKTTANRVLYVYSDITPKIYGYKIVNTFPHDREAFTQGLVYSGGRLFEGTGQEGASSLREVELASGKVSRQHNLDNNLFGEGITLFNDLIYQVTWTTKVGFVYEKETFKLLRKIYYLTEAWGLTTMDDMIVMSDGTNALWFYDPETFTVVGKVEVCDDTRQVEQLNELEYINGEIWANIWMTDRIARIDPLTGKVNGYVDFSGLMVDPEVNTDEDVLNGIAFDSDNNRIFVTGKNWPKLFEIKVVE